MPAYKRLINNAIDQGFYISVFDGEDWAVIRSPDPTEVCEAVEAVEMAELLIYDSAIGTPSVGWALLVMPPSVEPDESVADCTDNAIMNALLAS